MRPPSHLLDRSSHQRCSIKKKAVLKNFAKFTGKHLCQRPFFNKVAGTALISSKLRKSIIQWLTLKWKYETRYSRMDQVKFVEDNLLKIWSDMARLRRPYYFRFFKGCFPRILLGPFLNALTHLLFIFINYEN